MITVIYYRKYNRVTVEGHAQSGEAGHDIICAAASILVYTLAANVQNMEASGRVRDTVLKLNPGSAEIACKASNKYKAVVELVFSTVCAGFEILAADCPGNIRFEIHA